MEMIRGKQLNVEFKILYFLFIYANRFVSIVTVFVNKALLSSDTVKLDAPLFVTWVQCVISVLICLLIGLIKRAYLPNPFDVFGVNTIRTVSFASICSARHHRNVVVCLFSGITSRCSLYLNGFNQ